VSKGATYFDTGHVILKLTTVLKHTLGETVYRQWFDYIECNEIKYQKSYEVVNNYL